MRGGYVWADELTIPTVLDAAERLDGFGARSARSAYLPPRGSSDANFLTMDGSTLSGMFDPYPRRQWNICVADCSALGISAPYVRYEDVEASANGTCRIVRGRPTCVRYRLLVKLYKLEIVGLSVRFRW